MEGFKMFIGKPNFIYTMLAFLIFFAGCQYVEIKPPEPVMSDVPIPSAYVASGQHKMQAIHHWEVLAKEIAARVEAKMAKDLPRFQEPVYVAPAGITPFDKAFYDLLITSLVNGGLAVTHNSQNPLVLSFNTQILSHKRLPVGNSGTVRVEVPKKEVIITLSLIYQGAYLMRDSSVFYINAPEWWHYAQKAEVVEPVVAVYTLVNK